MTRVLAEEIIGICHGLRVLGLKNMYSTYSYYFVARYLYV